MGKLTINDKGIAIPGEKLAEGMDYLPALGTFREGDSIYASHIGLVNVSGRLVKVIPLSGRYTPKKGDMIIGKVVDMGFSGWRVDFGWAFEANLSMKDATSEFVDKRADLSQYYDFGDIIAAQITHVSGSKIIDLSMRGPGLKKLRGGKLIEITPSKVPRVIGKQGSMISMIKEKTGCKVLVGQNGIVWVSGDREGEVLATKAILKIERESHLGGLTDKIKELLEKK